MKKTLLIVGVVFILLLGGFFAFNSYIYNEKQADQSQSLIPYTGTLSGEYVCLPHADTTGPQTEECAAGIKTDSGEYYALDLNQVSQEKLQLSSGDKFSATGLITPIENISSNLWQRYDIEGIFSIENPVQKL